MGWDETLLATADLGTAWVFRPWRAPGWPSWPPGQKFGEVKREIEIVCSWLGRAEVECRYVGENDDIPTLQKRVPGSSSTEDRYDVQKAAFPWTDAPAFTIVTALLDTSFTKAALYSSTQS